MLHGDAAARLAELRARRTPLYAEVADVIIATDGKTPLELVQQVIAALRQGR
ncbi:MAG: shikimate kinase [Chloroflexus sp.]|uniref:shikimate kinase n=1 Tax=Chloroflexus sp. TaxID=1904827 RepID=UPI00404B9F23